MIDVSHNKLIRMLPPEVINELKVVQDDSYTRYKGITDFLCDIHRKGYTVLKIERPTI